MAKTCRTGYTLVGNRCIRVKPISSAPNTGAGFTQDGVPIVSKDNPDLASELYGANSIKRGDKLDGELSGTEKLIKDKYISSGGSTANKTTSVNQYAQNQVAKLPKVTTAQDYSYLEASAPRLGATESGKDYQLRVSNWERDQATKQANAIAAETVNIRSQQESDKRTNREETFKRKGKESELGNIGGLGEKINPAFTAMSEEEKRFNANLPEAERVKETIEFSESDLSADQKAARAKGINVRITDEQREGVVDSAVATSFIDPATGKVKSGDVADHMFKVKQFMGAEAGDRVEMREDGSYYLKDETGEDVDPIKRAEDKVRKKEEKAREIMDENFRINSDRVKNQHRTPDGGITEQGKAELQKLQIQYNTDDEEMTDTVDDMLDAAITSEKSRQIDVQTQFDALGAKKTLSFSEEISKAKVDRLNQLKKEGLTPMVALAQVEREYSMMKSDPDKLKLNNFISGLDESGIAMENQFEKVYQAAGKNSDKAYNAMKVRYGEFQAKALRDEFLAKNNWSEEQIARKDVKSTIADFWAGEVTDPDEVGKFMEQLDDMGYSDDFKKKQLGAMIISPTLSEGVKDEARALLKEDFDGGEDKPATEAELDARFLAGDMEPKEATQYLKNKALLEDGVSAGGDVVSGRMESALLRVKTGRITNRNMEAMEERAFKEGWGDKFAEAIKLGTKISDKQAQAFGLPETTTEGELDAVIAIRQSKGGGNKKYQADVKIPENLTSLLDEERNAKAMLAKYAELVAEAGPRPFEGALDKGSRQASRVWQGLGGKPSKELKIYNELEALSGEILADYIKRMSGAAVSEAEAQRLSKNKPNIGQNSTQFEDQMDRYLEDIQDAIDEKTTTFGFENSNEMGTAVRGGYTDVTRDEIDEYLGGPGASSGKGELLDLIGDAEAEGQYNAVFGDANQTEIDFSGKTLKEVSQYQTEQVFGGSPSSAVGKYQFLQKTLTGLQKEMGLTGDEKFTPELQDQMAEKLLERRGWNEFLEGKIDMEELQRRLSQEWASLPTDSSDKSYYQGDGLNKASVSSNTLRKTITQNG